MKQLVVFGMMFMAIGETAFAGDFHRFWRGFRRTDLSPVAFEQELEQRFMPATVQVGEGRGLNSYLVVIPPADRPSFIPDELALVTYESEAAYRAIRATPEGQAYSDMHWDVFQRDVSRSAVPETLGDTAALEAEKAYDMFGASIDWQSGVTFAFIGLRKEGVSSENFLAGLASHLRLVKRDFADYGLDGYLALATVEYELAFLHFPSQAAAERAFASEAGARVRADADAILNPIMFEAVKTFVGDVRAPDFVNVPVRR